MSKKIDILSMTDTMFEEFKFYEPKNAVIAIEYYAFSKYELMVLLNDGRKILFDYLEKTTRYIDADSNGELSEEEWRSEFSRRFRRELRLSGYSQRDLADRTGISPMAICKYVNGQAIPTLYNIEKIAKALGCEVETFLHFPR